MAYDAQARRISKKTDNIKTTFTWDGDFLLSDNIGGNNPREFVFYPNSFEPLAFIDKDKNIHYFHNDLVGLPQEITDSKNNIVWSARYNSQGNIDKIFEEKIDNPIRFQGQYYDSELDLSYNRFRYFDANTGSFISQDPLGLAAGTNLYRYASNVWGWVDPLGLCKTASKNLPADNPWPPNCGFLGKQNKQTLEPGTVIDRYGYEGGSFVSPEGVPFKNRALHPSSATKPYNKYEVAKPVDVDAGVAGPWFGEPGGGIQYELPSSVSDLIEQGVLKRLP